MHVCVTSPPYWGLRDYGIPPSIWGGRDHYHVWEDATWRDGRHTAGAGEKQQTNRGHDSLRDKPRAGDTCGCGAWRGALGLEPTPELFLEHVVMVFQEVRRVLHSSGSLWVNMGDSYLSDSGSERMPTTLPGARVPAGWTNRAQPYHTTVVRAGTNLRGAPERVEVSGPRSKDLCMMPARVALALQQDGWILRSQIPWLKTCPMPESVTDRPVSAVEYIYQFAKHENYFYDREAVRIAASGTANDRGCGMGPETMGPNSRMNRDQDPAHQTAAKIRAKNNRSFSEAVKAVVSTRARRNSDHFMESLRGLIQDENGDPLAMLVNPQPFSIEMCAACETVYEQKDYRKLVKVCKECGAENLPAAKKCVACAAESFQRRCTCGAIEWVSHFATFPEAMVTPLILSGTSEAGCCQHCGAPYVRILEERPKSGDWQSDPEHKHDAGAVNGISAFAKRKRKYRSHAESQGEQFSQVRMLKAVAEARAAGAEHDNPFPGPVTLGWQPICSHPLFPSESRPCVVLDPFSGSGRTGLAALKLGRDYIGIDASVQYNKMAQWQLEKLVPRTTALEPSEEVGA